MKQALQDKFALEFGSTAIFFAIVILSDQQNGWSKCRHLSCVRAALNAYHQVYASLRDHLNENFVLFLLQLVGRSLAPTHQIFQLTASQYHHFLNTVQDLVLTRGEIKAIFQ